MMDIQFNTDNQIHGGADVSEAIEARLRERLARFSSRLTRIEVHGRDVDGTTNGESGVELTLEARPAGQQPLSVTGNGPELEAALNSALPKLVSRLDSVFGRLDRVR